MALRFMSYCCGETTAMMVYHVRQATMYDDEHRMSEPESALSSIKGCSTAKQNKQVKRWSDAFTHVHTFGLPFSPSFARYFHDGSFLRNMLFSTWLFLFHVLMPVSLSDCFRSLIDPKSTFDSEDEKENEHPFLAQFQASSVRFPF